MGYYSIADLNEYLLECLAKRYAFQQFFYWLCLEQGYPWGFGNER